MEIVVGIDLDFALFRSEQKKKRRVMRMRQQELDRLEGEEKMEMEEKNMIEIEGKRIKKAWVS